MVNAIKNVAVKISIVIYAYKGEDLTIDKIVICTKRGVQGGHHELFTGIVKEHPVHEDFNDNVVKGKSTGGSKNSIQLNILTI